MKRILLIVSFIIIMISLTSCKEITKEEEFNNIQKTLNSISTYECKAEITIVGNKSSKDYKVYHKFKKPNKYIAEIIAPEDNKGNKTMYNGKQVYLYNKSINQYEILKSYNITEEKMLFLGYFLRNLNMAEEVEIDEEKVEDKDYIIIKLDIPGNNKYRVYEKLWVDKKTHIPYKLVIFDEKDKETVNVVYKDIEYNKDIQDDNFRIK